MRSKYLKNMNIDIWKPKESLMPSRKFLSKSNEHAVLSHTNSSQLNISNQSTLTTTAKTWEDLENCVKFCQLCLLYKSRLNTVFGVGDKKAKLMLIGEAPGATEDQKGEPFVGRAGILLTAMLRSINLERSDIYIANILKCRPPNNRDPLQAEVDLCTNYLLQQIDLIKPSLIVAVGRIAAHFLLKTNVSMSALRNRQYQFGKQKIPLLAIYHPAYLLRSPREKRKAYHDLLTIKTFLGK